MVTFYPFLHISCLLLLISGSYEVNLGENDPVICSTNGVGCEYDENNLISTVFKVPSLPECRQLCIDDDNCEFITYFNASTFPIPKECRLYRSCEIVNDCANCVSENVDCFETCGSNLVGLIDDNFITATPSIESELECKRYCVTHGGCSWYTYFWRNDTLNHGYCFLLTELLQPTELSNTASSGPRKCSDNSPSSTTSISTTTATTTPTSSCFLQRFGRGETGNVRTGNGYQLWGTEETYNISVLGVGGWGSADLYPGGAGKSGAFGVRDSGVAVLRL